MADEDTAERAEATPMVAAVQSNKVAERTRYFTPSEVAMHNRAEVQSTVISNRFHIEFSTFTDNEQDCWVAIYRRVLDITPLLERHRGILTQPLVRHAGEEISHWFDQDTLEVQKHVDPETDVELPFFPHGRFLHAPPQDPTANWNTMDVLPWWRDPQYVVGFLTEKARWIEIVNVLTQQRHALQVCCEETIDEIQTRYVSFNAHARSYTWKFLEDGEFVPLQMELTLDANGIVDETPLFETLDMDEHAYKPSLYIYFNDDLSVA